MPLLFNAFVSTAPEDRGPIARAIAAYSMACDPPTAEALFRTVLQKLLKIVQDAAAPEMPRDQITDGGDTPLERRCTFTDLALALAGGLGAEGHAALYSVAKGGIEDAEASVQKRSYKVLGYLCQSAPGFLEREGQGVLELLKSAQSKCQSAARRFRLRAVQALAVMAAKNGASLVPVGAEEVERMDAEDKRAHVLTQLLSEVVLSLKEINKKTRYDAHGSTANWRLIRGLDNSLAP